MDPKSDLKALRILVVDDEENIRFAISMCLETDGHRVVAVGTIDEALDQSSRQAFDLIFLDVRLGTLNGLDFIKPLLEESPWARIVVITAYASIETAVEAMKSRRYGLSVKTVRAGAIDAPDPKSCRAAAAGA